MSNMIQYINHDQLGRSLLLLWLADIPACIIGGVGCGKTTAVEALVEKLNASEQFKGDGFNLWKVFLGLIDATEVGGIPYRAENGQLNYAPPATLPYNTNAPGIIFGDEYDRAPPDVQNAFNQILLGREIHGNKISENAYVVLAMNGESDRYTTPLSEAARNRVCTLFLSSHAFGNLENWDEYARKVGINDTIRAFAHCRTDLIERHETFTEQALMTFRSRDMAGRLLDAVEKASFRTDDILLPCLSGVIGSGAANELLAFIEIQDKLPNIKDMLEDPAAYEGHEVFKRSDLTFMLSIAVASYVDLHHEAAGPAFRLISLAPPEIQVWAARLIEEAYPQAVTTKEYIEHFDRNVDLVT